MIQMLGRLTLSQRSLRLSWFLLILFSFSFIPLCFIYFYHSVLYLTYPIFCLCYSPVGSLQNVFYLIYCIIPENAMAPHSSTLAWKIPWVEEPGGLQSMWSLRVGHDWASSLSLLCIGEGHGNLLQCSCLVNTRDGGTWWAAISGVAHSRTRLKRHSSIAFHCIIHYILTLFYFF